MKRTSCSENEEEDDDNEEQHPMTSMNSEKDNNIGDPKKSDWMRSVQLWNQTSDPPLKEVKSSGQKKKKRRRLNSSSICLS